MAVGNRNTQAVLNDARDVLGARLTQVSGIVTVMRRDAEANGEGECAEALWGVEDLLAQALDAYRVLEHRTGSTSKVSKEARDGN